MGQKNNRWRALSMKDRAFLIREGIRNGITDLNEVRDLYNNSHRLGTPYRTFEAGSDYDYYNAAPENKPDNNDGHWTSRNPYTGQILKHKEHPTYYKTVQGEKEAGYEIKQIGDREYSFPRGSHQFSGEENISNKTYISTKPKNNIKTGNVEFDLFDFNTWRYRNSPTYSKDTDFTLAFTDALLDGEKNFKWGDNYYSTEIDYTKKFTDKKGKKPFEEFADYMYPAVIQVLQENNMPIDMAHNIVRQAAMESDYGLSPRGDRGFNLSGIKWTETAGKSGYKYTKGSDGQKYIDFKDLKEYLNYKVRTLQNNYNALDASSVHDYVEALHPKAFGKKPRSKNYKGDYSAGAENYKKSMTGMSSLDKTLMNELYFPLFGK